MVECNFCECSFDLSKIEEGYLKKIGNKFLCIECLEDLKNALDLKSMEHDIEYYTWDRDEISDIALEEIKRVLIELDRD